MKLEDHKRELLDGQTLNTQKSNNETGENSNEIKVVKYIKAIGALSIVAAVVFFILYVRNRENDSTVSIMMLSFFISCMVDACIFYGFAKIIELLYDISLSLKKDNKNSNNKS
ncbi:MAG: hypothetical protein VZQ61_05195 [Christensenellaceae bacterium]